MASGRTSNLLASYGLVYLKKFELSWTGLLKKRETVKGEAFGFFAWRSGLRGFAFRVPTASLSQDDWGLETG